MYLVWVAEKKEITVIVEDFHAGLQQFHWRGFEILFAFMEAADDVR